METRENGTPDRAASITVVLVALLALGASWWLPWWRMEARAPQYGQRTLVVTVGPRQVSGDVFEVDTLGHYVGIRKLEELAQLERRAAPFGFGLALLGIAAAALLRKRWMRALAAAPVVLMPLLFLGDLYLWMNVATNERDPEAPLNNILARIDTKLFGEYVVAQFKVTAVPTTGLYLVGVAALLAIGLVFAAPLPLPARKRRRVSEAAVAALLLCALPGSAGASIQSAIDAAVEGGTVLVPAGVHHERPVLDRRVRLVGEPGAILDGGGEGTILRITASGVEVRGLTLRRTGKSYTVEDAAIRVEKASGVRIADVRMEDVLFGVFALQADQCVIERSHIVGWDLESSRRGDGIRLWYSSGCRITGNTVERSRDVVIWYSSGTVVTDNLVRASRYGLHYMYSDDNTFHHNRFEDNEVGAAIMYSRGIHLSENAFSFSNGTSAYGLLVKDADDVFVTDNRFVGNATGMFWDNAPQSRNGRAVVRGNLVARNGVGLALQPLTRGIVFTENSFIGNRKQVEIHGAGDASGAVWAQNGRGNYWSDGVLYDRDHNGVSELPYRAESTYEVLSDRWPVLAFFESTPGAEAIDMAARLFPIFAPRPRLVDPAPLTEPRLTPWTRGEESTGRRPGLALCGAGLLALAVAAAVAGKRALA